MSFLAIPETNAEEPFLTSPTTGLLSRRPFNEYNNEIKKIPKNSVKYH